MLLSEAYPMKLKVEYVRGEDLKRTYWGVSSPQPAEVQLDLQDGILTAGYCPSRFGPLWFKSFFRTWYIPYISTEEIREVLDDLSPLAQRAVDGYDTVDGNDPDHIIVDMTPDGETALLEIGYYLQTRFGDMT